MAVVLTRQPFSKEERDILIDAAMNGTAYEDWPELQEVADEVAMKLPELLRRAGWEDSSENRRKIIDLVLVRWAMPKGPLRSRSYRRLARR
jgi:hypothetical protein